MDCCEEQIALLLEEDVFRDRMIITVSLRSSYPHRVGTSGMTILYCAGVVCKGSNNLSWNFDNPEYAR